MKTLEEKTGQGFGGKIAIKHRGMSLAFVLMVMLIGGALTGAALWIVENATRTTRMAKQNTLLYDATQEGLQRGLTSLGILVGGLTSADDMPGRTAVLSPKGSGEDDTWWQELLCVSADGILYSVDFTPSGAGELLNLKASWQIFSLHYSQTFGGTLEYVPGIPPKVPVKVVRESTSAIQDVTAKQSYEEKRGNRWGGAFLIVSTATSEATGGRVLRKSSLGVVLEKYER